MGNFLGNTNLLELPVTRQDNESVAVKILDWLVPVGAPPESQAERLTVSLRPERIRLKGDDADLAVPATIRSREFLGSAWQFEADTGVGTIAFNVPHVGAGAPMEGDNVQLFWKSGDMRAVYAD